MIVTPAQGHEVTGWGRTVWTFGRRPRSLLVHARYRFCVDGAAAAGVWIDLCGSMRGDGWLREADR
ncbi:MAG: hypothetical protein F4Z29_00505 [Gemmatimonadetes bacterium]|nr:hypothetical protein [Gemmatimonadota bacterium]